MPMANQEPALEYISAKDVKVRPVKWLWPFLSPKGRLHFFREIPEMVRAPLCSLWQPI